MCFPGDMNIATPGAFKRFFSDFFLDPANWGR